MPGAVRTKREFTNLTVTRIILSRLDDEPDHREGSAGDYGQCRILQKRLGEEGVSGKRVYGNAIAVMILLILQKLPSAFDSRIKKTAEKLSPPPTRIYTRIPDMYHSGLIRLR